MQSKERKEEKEEGSDRDNREFKKKGQVDTVGMETCVDDICHYSSLHSR